VATRYRAEHVGSLLRPPDLLEARAARAAGRLEPDALRAAEDQAILGALALQREVGLDVYSDGEFRRDAWMSDLAEAVEGFVPERVPMQWRGPGGGVEGSRALVAGARLRPTRRLTAPESSFLLAHSPGPFKITMPSPSVFILASYRAGITDRHYATRADLLADLVPIVREEIRALIAEGVPYIQLDAPQYTYYLDPGMREGMRQEGIDPERSVDEAVAGDVACLAGLAQEGVTSQSPTAAQRGPTTQLPTAAQRGPTLAFHLCRGNNRSRWIAEGGYDAIAERLFGSLPVDTFLLEYDSERAGDFAPLRFVPRDKTVALGLITTKAPTLEAQDDLRRRIEAAARYLPLENLALSPQCGFASVAAGNLLSPDDQRRKLELLVDTARKVWG
jgi:5-methyltetrahydropteroyltriglutamate--homocysteine methyltransferase